MTAIPATILRWGGGLLAAALIASGANSVADLLAQHGVGEPVQTYAAPKELYLTATGTIDVRVDEAASQVQVQAVAQTGFATPRLTTAADDEQRSIDYSCPQRLSGSCSTLLTVTVPPGVGVAAWSDSGDVYVDGGKAARSASLTASSVTGSVTVVGWHGEVAASSTSGAVDVSDVQGATELHSTTADLTATNVDGTCDATSSSGTVRLTSVQGNVTAATTTGDILVTGEVDVLPVALSARTQTGETTIRGLTDPAGLRTVTLTSVSGDLTYQ